MTYVQTTLCWSGKAVWAVTMQGQLGVIDSSDSLNSMCYAGSGIYW